MSEASEIKLKACRHEVEELLAQYKLQLKPARFDACIEFCSFYFLYGVTYPVHNLVRSPAVDPTMGICMALRLGRMLFVLPVVPLEAESTLLSSAGTTIDSQLQLTGDFVAQLLQSITPAIVVLIDGLVKLDETVSPANLDAAARILQTCFSGTAAWKLYANGNKVLTHLYTFELTADVAN